MQDKELPKLEGEKTEDCFGYHALNYRTAHHLHAQAMWEDLERFTQAWGRRCYEAGLEAAAEKCEQEYKKRAESEAKYWAVTDEVKMPELDCAAAIRTMKGKP